MQFSTVFAKFQLLTQNHKYKTVMHTINKKIVLNVILGIIYLLIPVNKLICSVKLMMMLLEVVLLALLLLRFWVESVLKINDLH